jgi:hypothetical protein
MPTKAEENAMLLDRATTAGGRAEAVIRVLEGNRTLGARLFAPNYIEHKPWSGPRLKKAVRPKTAIPNLKLTVEDAIESGDRVVVRWRAQGTHSGRITGIKPTGKRIDVTGINIYRFAGGRIVESWGQADIAALQAQCAEIQPEIFEFFAKVRTAPVG